MVLYKYEMSHHEIKTANQIYGSLYISTEWNDEVFKSNKVTVCKELLKYVMIKTENEC